MHIMTRHKLWAVGSWVGIGLMLAALMLAVDGNLVAASWALGFGVAINFVAGCASERLSDEIARRLVRLKREDER